MSEAKNMYIVITHFLSGRPLINLRNSLHAYKSKCLSSFSPFEHTTSGCLLRRAEQLRP